MMFALLQSRFFLIAIAAALLGPWSASASASAPSSDTSMIASRQSTDLKTLEQWQRHNCQGRGRVCFDMPQLSCCENPQQFSSGRCRECLGSQLHAIFRLGRGVCDTPVGGTNGNACVTFRNLRGSEWCQGCRPNKRDDLLPKSSTLRGEDLAGWPSPQSVAGSNAEPCRKANMITLDGSRWFKVNYDVPEEHTSMLEAWWASDDATYEQMPEVLLQYETVYNPSEPSED